MTAPEEATVVVEHLCKSFGPITAVDDLSFTVRPGVVTGFLGPNGAGKTTTLRMLLGLVRPTSGRATIGGVPYAALRDPLRRVGAALEATGFHAGRTARDHLRVQAAAAGLPTARVDASLQQVGLEDAAGRRVGGFSLGMRQRLALAAALLGDPQVLVLDEPANGLDPAGIAWLRGFVRYFAAQGRTVLLSSHVLSEVQQTVDEVVVIAHGRLVRHAPLADLEGPPIVLVRTPQVEQLAVALAHAGLPAEPGGDGALLVTGAEPARVGEVAHRAGVVLHELARRPGDLEHVFLALTREGPR
ncbi:MAG: ATP-binding cassette domain-containing protein [Acidimicrobiales bacterium]